MNGRALLNASMTETQFQEQVIDLAHTYGWMVAHFRPAKTEKGWRTAVSGDGKGFPDLVLVRDDTLIFAELKSERGRLSPEQVLWLQKLQPVSDWGKPVHQFVWKPSDWDLIKVVLKGPE